MLLTISRLFYCSCVLGCGVGREGELCRGGAGRNADLRRDVSRGGGRHHRQDVAHREAHSARGGETTNTVTLRT